MLHKGHSPRIGYKRSWIIFTTQIY